MNAGSLGQANCEQLHLIQPFHESETGPERTNVLSIASADEPSQLDNTYVPFKDVSTGGLGANPVLMRCVYTFTTAPGPSRNERFVMWPRFSSAEVLRRATQIVLAPHGLFGGGMRSGSPPTAMTLTWKTRAVRSGVPDWRR